MKSSVFIDSNVWFSAFYKEGSCSKLLRDIKSSGWKVFVSELVLEEVIRNIQLKIPHVLPFFINYLKENKVVVFKNPASKLLVQHKKLAKFEDLPIIISAFESKCDYFITGNIKDFNIVLINKIFKIKILTPTEFLKQINK
ncbi:MAG: PIN domain-containing protein [Candidatus Roizmanbacteria bacterium]|nr:PIN domain-containing protein [Candidatus Roizmanbacteria bacterium]